MSVSEVEHHGTDDKEASFNKPSFSFIVQRVLIILLFLALVMHYEKDSTNEISISVVLRKQTCLHGYVIYMDQIREKLRLLLRLWLSTETESERNHPFPWPAHTYADYYHSLFSHCRSTVKNVFECGIGTNNPDVPSSMGIHGKPGASLRVWYSLFCTTNGLLQRDYFPNATVYGADVDANVLFEEERIKTFHVNKLDPNISVLSR